MHYLRNLAGICLSAALLAACGQAAKLGPTAATAIRPVSPHTSGTENIYVAWTGDTYSAYNIVDIYRPGQTHAWKNFRR